MTKLKNIFTLSSQRKNLNNTPFIPSPDRRGLGGGIKNTKAFTLVELIIVITILAILATIAFISFQGFAKNARDGNRLATLKQLQNGLEVFATKTGYYPDPEGNILTGSINGVVFSNKGIFGDNSSRIIQASKTPSDPLNNSQYYIYATDSNKKQYQIATILETLNANKNNLIQETYAGNEGNYKSYVVGNYKGYIKYSSGSLTYLANIPSLIWNNTGSVDLLSGSTYFVANKSLNLPYKPNNDTNINISNGNEIIKQITGNQEGVLTGVNITPVISGTSVDSWLNSFGSNSGIILKSFTSLDNLSNGAKNLELAINGSVSVGNSSNLNLLKGDSSTNPGTSCNSIKSFFPSSADGIYRITIDGNSSFQVYCDMTNDGGGWTLVAIRGNTSIFSENIDNPLTPNSSKPGRNGNIWNNSSSFNFSSIKFTEGTNYAIVNFGTSSTIQSRNVLFSWSNMPTSTNVNTNTPYNYFYWKGMSGNCSPFADSCDYGYMVFDSTSSLTEGDGWDNNNTEWLLAGSDNSQDISVGGTTDYANGLNPGSSHWHTQVSGNTFVRLK